MAEKRSFSISYEEEEGRPTLPVSGAYGGASVDGTMVVAHIYSEFGTLPALEEHEISEEGVIDLTKGNFIRRSDLTRKILATLVMSPEVAGRLAKWLSNKADRAAQNKKEYREE